MRSELLPLCLETAPRQAAYIVVLVRNFDWEGALRDTVRAMVWITRGSSRPQAGRPSDLQSPPLRAVLVKFHLGAGWDMSAASGPAICEAYGWFEDLYDRDTVRVRRSSLLIMDWTMGGCEGICLELDPVVVRETRGC